MKQKKLLAALLLNFFYIHAAALEKAGNVLSFGVAVYVLQENLTTIHDGTFWLLSPLATQNSAARNLIGGGFCVGMATTATLCALQKKAPYCTLTAANIGGITVAAALALRYPETRASALLTLAYPALFYLKTQNDETFEKIITKILCGLVLGELHSKIPLGDVLKYFIYQKKSV